MFRTARIAIAAASLAAALALPSAASANELPRAGSEQACTEAHDSTAPAYDVRLCAPSDVDQLRPGLLNNGGPYSGPAAMFNVLNGMWLRQGLPVFLANVPIGLAQPTVPALFDNTTAYLQKIADVSGLGESLAKHRAAFHTATAHAYGWGWSLASGSVDTLTTSEFGLAMAQRLRWAPVQMRFAHYKPNGSSYERQMGHMVSVVSAKGSTGTGEFELTFYDSARAPDNSMSTQSAYVLHTATLKRVEIDVKVGDAVQSNVRWELTAKAYPSTEERHMVEGFNWFSALKQ